MIRNQPGQTLRVFAYSRITGLGVEGDAANITGSLSLDNGPFAPTNDVNPTEESEGGGFYRFNTTQAETNAHVIYGTYQSSTPDVIVIGVLGTTTTVVPGGTLVASAYEAGEISSFPRFLRKQDARTVANGNAILLRLYSDDDTPVLLYGSGSLLFADAERIVLSLIRKEEETPQVEIPIEWVTIDDSDDDLDDGYFLITYDETALDDCDDVLTSGYTYHYWGIKVQWPSTPQPITVADGMVRIKPLIATTEVTS